MKELFAYKDFEGLKDLKAVKDVDIKGRTITGYFAAFNNVDLGGDLIEPGAFTKTIAERGPQGSNRIFFLNQHDTWQILGKPAVLKEDGYGLYHESKVVDTGLGNDVLKLFSEGIMDSFSIGYRVLTENRVNDVNHLKDLFLYEGSAVTFPMNESAIATGVKGIDVDRLQRKIKQIEKFCRESDVTDETNEVLLLTIKQLNQIILDLMTTTPPASTTGPGKQEKDESASHVAGELMKEVSRMQVINELNVKLF